MRRAALVSLLLLAACGGEAPVCSFDPAVDQPTCETLSAMQLPAEMPADPTNAWLDDPDAATLGYRLFYAKNLSGQSPLGCPTCHMPAEAFTERSATARGIDDVPRNAPTAINAAWTSTIFWDGRVDVMWAQPIDSLENPRELNFSRLELAHAVADHYAAQYEKVFGPLPELADLERFPPAGRPGDEAFEQMSPDDQEAVNRIAANVGKSIAAFLRKLAAGRSPFDEFLAGRSDAITPHQELGMLLFVDHGCVKCHSGPQLSDQRFHNAGVSPLPDASPDRGRADGIVAQAAALFSAASPYSDRPEPAPVLVPTAADLGAFRTPSLRNVAVTEPYMHNGSIATLREAVDFHLDGGGSGYLGELDPDLAPRDVSDEDRDAIVDFLQTLTGVAPPSPWNFWPGGP